MQDREFSLAPTEEASLRDAFRRLTANKAQATLLAKGLKDIFEERAFVELWLENLSTVTTPEWVQLLLMKAPKGDQDMVGLEEKSARDVEVKTPSDTGRVSLGREMKLSEVRQGSTDLPTFVVQFEQRMRMLHVEEGRWKGYFESAVNYECRTLFWASRPDTSSFREMVTTMIRQSGQYSKKQLFKELDLMYQRPGDTATELRFRLEQWYQKRKYVTGQDYSNAELGERLLAKLVEGEHVELLVEDLDNVDDIVRVANALGMKRSFAEGKGKYFKETKRPEIPKKPENVVQKYKNFVKAQHVSASTDSCKHCGGKHGSDSCWKKYPHLRPQKRVQAQALGGRLVSGKAGGRSVSILLDSCADVSVSTRSAVEPTWQRVNEETDFLWGKTPVRSDEAYAVRIIVDGVSTIETLFIVEDELIGDADVLLSAAASERLGWVMQKLEEKKESEDADGIDLGKEMVLEDFELLSADAGIAKAARRLPVARSLSDLRQPAKVPAVEFQWSPEMELASFNLPQRKYKPEQEAYLQERAKEMVSAGIASHGDSVYASPWLTVKKPKGGFRECVDMRLVNTFMKLSQFPCTSTREVLRCLGDPRWSYFTELDLKVAFWQIPISYVDGRKCAVRGPDGILLIMHRLPQGGRDSSAQLERVLVDCIGRPFADHFREKAACVIYRDNLFLATMDVRTHLEVLNWLAEKSKELNFRFGSGSICGKSVSVLGYELSEECVRPARAALEKLRMVEVPKSRRELRGILGSFNYYRGLVPGYAEIVAPLEALLPKDATFNWTLECMDALQQLKARVEVTSTVRYDPRSSSRIYCDASLTAAGAVLVQGDPGRIVGVF